MARSKVKVTVPTKTLCIDFSHTCNSTAGSRKILFIKPVCRSTVPVDQTTVFENFRKYYENSIKSVPISLFRHAPVLLMPIDLSISSVLVCGRRRLRLLLPVKSNQIASFVTPVKPSVVTFDIENLHFDVNKHSGMIRDQKWLGSIK